MERMKTKYVASGNLVPANIDMAKYYSCFNNPGDYVGRQLCLEET